MSYFNEGDLLYVVSATPALETMHIESRHVPGDHPVELIPGNWSTVDKIVADNRKLREHVRDLEERLEVYEPREED